MTTSTQFLQQNVEDLLHDYPQIATQSDLDHALTGLSPLTVCGNIEQRECDVLSCLIEAAGEESGCRPVFVASPSLSVPRETLLYHAHLTEHQLIRLLRQLYDTDAVICGVLSPSLLAE